MQYAISYTFLYTVIILYYPVVYIYSECTLYLLIHNIGIITTKFYCIYIDLHKFSIWPINAECLCTSQWKHSIKRIQSLYPNPKNILHIF